MGKEKLSVSDQDLTTLIKDLEEMQSYVETKIKRLNLLVESVDKDGKGPSAAAYKKLQRDVSMDAVRIRQMLNAVEEATKAQGADADPQYLDLLHRFQALQKSPEGQQELGLLGL
ncbi:hypothetical protein [Streptomyces sp. ME19-01-6]|uniref:hypothetical protein n=1 Tax=Streptomyces sp. ME19-01-6 TaxID=3028686 RepID=UPI0029B98CD0|nr:hypothetical protein [Streptomyces sp. ME19-01-6]MDX3226423.1 hypothetical protein [Streptomyces sp. ME19-01-6]